jgi:hypothetical protein
LGGAGFALIGPGAFKPPVFYSNISATPDSGHHYLLA